MSADFRRLRQVRGLALLIGALSLVVVAVSAYLRLEAAGVGCSDWPACYGQILGGTPPALHYGLARLIHRIAASAALVLACVMVWRCLRPAPLGAVVRPAVLLLVLMLVLSVLGFFSADPRRSLVAFLNIVGGLGLVTFSWRVVIAAQAGEAVAPPGRAVGLGVLALSATVALGAWLGASYASVACLELPSCSMDSLDAAAWRALDPLRLATAPASPGAGDGVLLNLLHRGLALGALLVLGFGAWSQRRGARAAPARAILLLLPLVFVLGVASIASGLGLWLVVAHGVLAAVLLAAVASLLRR